MTEDDFEHAEWKKNGSTEFKLDDYLTDVAAIAVAQPPNPGSLVLVFDGEVYNNIDIFDMKIACKMTKLHKTSPFGDPTIVVAVDKEIVYVVHPETCGWTSLGVIDVVESI